jgi:hypothetical protein
MAGVACAHFGRALTDDIDPSGVTLEAAGGMCVAPMKPPDA